MREAGSWPCVTSINVQRKLLVSGSPCAFLSVTSLNAEKIPDWWVYCGKWPNVRGVSDSSGFALVRLQRPRRFPLTCRQRRVLRSQRRSVHLPLCHGNGSWPRCCRTREDQRRERKKGESFAPLGHHLVTLPLLWKKGGEWSQK